MSQKETLLEFLNDRVGSQPVTARELSVLAEGAEFFGIGVGQMTAEDTAAIFEDRSRSLKRAGIDAEALDQAMVELRRVAPDTSIQLHHFQARDKHLTVFASAEGRQVFGYVIVPRRDHLRPRNEAGGE